MIQHVKQKILLPVLKTRIRDVTEHPLLAQLSRGKCIVDGQLESRYLHYVLNVSRADMAASLECVSLLKMICMLLNCKKALDLGSGFSSFVLRQLVQQRPGMKVWSVDDDDKWIETTRSYLIREDVGVENLLSLKDFTASSENNFDLIFLDLNLVEVRKNYIKLAVQRCKRGGIIVFDDVHKPEYLYEVLSQTRSLGVDLYDMKELSLDKYGRYCIVGVKED